ncbi:MFS transporter [Rummeliibacillus pycnus]|uniref:MFS transporter n=1 Tax=Rummeliibacillus pycnus TaxID=101070 RepID=UPI003D295466
MKFSQLPPNLKVRLVSAFFNRVAMHAVLPFMALFFTHEKSKFYAGTILMISVGVSICANILGGYAADRWKRKSILIISALSAATMVTGMTICLIPNNTPIILFTFFYLFYVFSSDFGMPAMEAIVLDSTTPENRKDIYAMEYWLVNMSFSIGAVLGGVLYIKYQFALFILLAVINWSLALCYIFLLQNDGRPKKNQLHNNMFKDLWNSYKTALKDTRFVILIVGAMLVSSSESMLSSYISVRLSETFEPITILGFKIEGVRMFSLLSFENTLLVVCTTFLVSKMTNNMNYKNALISGLIIYGIGYSLMMSGNEFYYLLILGVIATLGELMYSPIYFTEQANRIPEDRRGAFLAFASLSHNGSTLLSHGALIIGTFLLPWHMSILLATVVLLGICCIYFALYIKKEEECRI